MIYIYAADVRHLEDPKRCPELLQSFDEDTQKNILNHNTSYNRINNLAINLFSKEVSARHQMSAQPNITDELESNSFHLCFSHSKNMMICVLSEKEAGCSIKKIEDAPKSLPVHFFNLQERKYLNNFNGEALNREFYRLCTIKESYIQMAGEVFSQPSKVLEVCIDEEVKIQREEHFEDCWIEEYSIPGYKISVCSKENEFVSDVKFITIL